MVADRSTIFAVPEGTADATQCGSSLLTVPHQHHADYLRVLEESDEDSQNIGEYDMVAPEELREVRTLVDQLETFQHEVST